MSMKFVLIIAIATLYGYFEQHWSPVHRLYGLNTCFTFNQVYLEAFGTNQKFENPFKAFKYVNEVCPL